jgi:hypothetical protein
VKGSTKDGATKDLMEKESRQGTKPDPDGDDRSLDIFCNQMWIVICELGD